MMRTWSKARSILAIAAVVVAIGACGGSSSSDEESSPDTTSTPEWEAIDRALAELAPEVGFLAARVTPDGTCEPIHEVHASTPRPMGSQFKLIVLGALADQIAAGSRSWDETLTVDDETKSLGNGEGSLQTMPPGTSVTLEEAATKMISISDNTAADMLIDLVGPNEVVTKAEQWTANASRNDPFLKTRQMFKLHYIPGLADQYLATPQEQRAAFLATSVDTRPIGDIGAGLTAEPRYIDTVEWFASPDDFCRIFAGLREQSTDPSLAPLPTILWIETGSLGLDRSEWPTIWFKGGSEPGVAALGWLATNSEGETFVVQGTLSNPDAALAPDSLTDLVAVAEDAFGQLS